MPPANQAPVRILFMGEAITLAHFVRPFNLALGLRELRGNVFESTFATSNNYRSQVAASGLPFLPIHCLDSTKFQSRLEKGQTYIRQAEIEEQIEEDLSIFKSVKPDLVIGDFRISLGFSARKAGIPYVAILNAFWPIFSFESMPVPHTPLLRFLGKDLGGFLFRQFKNRVVPPLLRTQARDYNLLRKKFGQPQLGSVIEAYSEADFLILADVPGFFPDFQFNKTPYAFIGPVSGTLPCELPSWYKDLDSTLPLIYVNLGSSGKQKLLPQILEALKDLPIQIVCGGSQASLYQSGRIFSAPFLPGDQICARADIVVCNGGAPSIYQAMTAGKPVIGITNNMDQAYGMSYYSKQESVYALDSLDFNPIHFKTLALQILGDQQLQRKAQILAPTLGQSEINQRFSKALLRALLPN